MKKEVSIGKKKITLSFSDDISLKKWDKKISTRELVSKICYERHIKEDFETFFIVNLQHIVQKYKEWIELMPRIRPYYAVKSNPNPLYLTILKEIGVGFDCASKGEIKIAMELKDGKKFGPDDIIFANTAKQIPHIKYAKENGVYLCTFDCIAELVKVTKYHPKAKLLLRIVTDDSDAVCKFVSKFGAHPEEVDEILSVAKKINANLCGIAFHVGSGSSNPNTFVTSLKDARAIFDHAKKKYSINMNILDIGGGFPGVDNGAHSNISFAKITQVINPAIEKLFPVKDNIKLIAEPGRYFSTGTMTLVCNVYLAKKIRFEKRKVDYAYFINDGLYRSFNCILFEHGYIPPLVTLKKDEFIDKNGKFISNAKVLPKIKYKSKLFGPTCDAVDTISECIELPLLDQDDWIYVENFGSYTTSASSTFNGYNPPEHLYYWKE